MDKNQHDEYVEVYSNGIKKGNAQGLLIGAIVGAISVLVGYCASDIYRRVKTLKTEDSEKQE